MSTHDYKGGSNQTMNYKKRIDTSVSGLSVEVGHDFEKSLRLFNKKVQESGLLREVRDRAHHVSASEVRKQAKKQAKMRWQKKQGSLDVRVGVPSASRRQR